MNKTEKWNNPESADYDYAQNVIKHPYGDIFDMFHFEDNETKESVDDNNDDEEEIEEEEIEEDDWFTEEFLESKELQAEIEIDVPEIILSSLEQRKEESMCRGNDIWYINSILDEFFDEFSYDVPERNIYGYTICYVTNLINSCPTTKTVHKTYILHKKLKEVLVSYANYHHFTIQEVFMQAVILHDFVNYKNDYSNRCPLNTTSFQL